MQEVLHDGGIIPAGDRKSYDLQIRKSNRGPFVSITETRIGRNGDELQDRILLDIPVWVELRTQLDTMIAEAGLTPAVELAAPEVKLDFTPEVTPPTPEGTPEVETTQAEAPEPPATDVTDTAADLVGPESSPEDIAAAAELAAEAAS